MKIVILSCVESYDGAHRKLPAPASRQTERAVRILIEGDADTIERLLRAAVRY